MNLIPHTWTTLKYAWSVRLTVLAVVLIWLEPVLSELAQDLTFKSVWIRLAVAQFVGFFGVAAIWARVTVQSTLHEKIAQKEQEIGKPPTEG
jgi:hypothetical protein